MKNKLVLLCFIAVLAIGSITFIILSRNSDDKQAQNEEVEINVDLDQATAEVATKIKENSDYKFVNHISIIADQDKKEVAFIFQVTDDTTLETSIEFANKAIKMLGDKVHSMDKKVKASSSNYYGGLYNTYDISFGLTQESKISILSAWHIRQIIPKGTHEAIKAQE